MKIKIVDHSVRAAMESIKQEFTVTFTFEAEGKRGEVVHARDIALAILDQRDSLPVRRDGGE